VLFDPDADLAVLRVSRTPGPPLRLLGTEAERGDGGAILGFPGGGDLHGERAAVRRPIEAVGRDIYGEHAVVRRVYELQASVEPGDSGGPFVVPSGRVAGIVFAASTTEVGVGYALASTDALDDLRQAAPLTASVGTGDCIA
jgi:S1-C subfamily serine protease